MADIVRRIPFEISGLGSGVGGSYNLQDNAYDYAIGGIPFLSGTRDQWPYTEGMAEIRKQQFDNFAEPGEQSLAGWWLRSQSTFTGGAGVLYQDPDNDNQFNYRFADSLGVDPWTSGEVKLLRNTVARTTGSTGTPLLTRGFVTGAGNNAAWKVENNTLSKHTATIDTSIIAAGAVIRSITSSGKRYYISKDDGIYAGDDGAAPVQWYTYVNAKNLVEFVKARLVAAVGRSLYQTPEPAIPPVALPAPFYTHPNPDWTWKSISEGPNAIYAAGDDGTTGAIFKFTLTNVGDVPTLTGGQVTATMPGGETINTIYGYIGSFLGISTSKGFRVGELDSGGEVSYGPLLFTVTGGTSGICGFDRFMWTGSTAAHNGSSGLYRIDLGSAVQEQTTRAVRYAYARDIYMDGQAGAVTSVSMFGNSDRKVFAVTSMGLALEENTTLIPSGFLQTGRVRYNTEEPKLYKFVSLRTPNPLAGNLSFSVVSQSGVEFPYVTYTPTLNPSQGDVGTPDPNGPQNWIALKFTLNRGSDTSTGAILNGWQIKALPGSIRQRIITQTFQLFDEEQDKTGQRIGTEGFARQRLEDFKSIARKGDITIFQELQDDVSNLVVIDDWRFTQMAPPGPDGKAIGGYLTVVMRTVAES